MVLLVLHGLRVLEVDREGQLGPGSKLVLGIHVLMDFGRLDQLLDEELPLGPRFKGLLAHRGQLRNLDLQLLFHN